MERGALVRIAQALEGNTPARAVPLTEEEAALIRPLQLLTLKPQVYAANVAEADLADGGASNPHVAALRQKAAEEGCAVIVISAQVRSLCGDVLRYQKGLVLWGACLCVGVFACVRECDCPGLRVPVCVFRGGWGGVCGG